MKDFFGRKINILDSKIRVDMIKNEILSSLGYSNGKFLPKYDKIIFVILDGLSYELAKKTKLKNYNLEKLRAAIPTSTAASLTSIYLGSLPAEHGILEQSFFLPELGTIYNIITNSTSFGKVDVNVEILTEKNTLFEEIPDKTVTFANIWFPSQKLAEINYRGADIIPSSDVFYNIYKIKEFIKKYNLIHIYDPEPDMTLHISNNKKAAIYQINKRLESIEEVLKKSKEDVLLVLASDHGHIKREKTIIKDELINRYYLRQEIAGGTRDLFIYPKDRFYEDILEGLKEKFYVFNGIDALEKGLFGEKIWEETEERMPDILAFPIENEAVDNFDQESDHGGLSKEELFGFIAYKEIKK